MVAPIDTKVTFEVEGEPVTLRLNFRALALAKKEGVNLMAGKELDALELAVAVRCLAAQDTEMSDDQALAYVVRHGEEVGKAVAALFTDFAGKSAGGNGKKAKPST